MAINALQPILRGATGKELQFTGDFHAYWDQLGISPGQFAERMAAWKSLPQNAAWIDATEDADAAVVVEGLWSNGEQGVWYDPSDMATMFQDAAGTLPAYMPGKGQVDPPVGLLLDKRKGFVRGPEVLTNGDFSAGSTGWAVAGSDATHIVTFSGGTLRFQSDTTTPQLSVAQLGTLVVGRWYEITVTTSAWVSGGVKSDAFVQGNLLLSAGVGTVKCVAIAANSSFNFTRNSANVDLTIDSISVRELPGNHAYQTTTTSRPTLSARYNLLTATEVLSTQSVAVAATTYTLTTGGAGLITLSGAASGTYAAGSRTVTCTAGTLTLTVSGSVTKADLRPANDGIGLPSYQRVMDANTYDTAGFPLYLKFDGVDDWLQTASVDFSGTDKIFVASALRKISDASSGIVVELTTNSGNFSGTFMLAAPSANGVNKFRFSSKGTAQADATTTSSMYSAPYSAVVACSGNIGAASVSLRVNGAVAAVSSAAQGTGNFTNAVLYIGRRGDATTAFNGRLYSILIRGAATPDTTIAKVELYLNQKARIY